MVWLPAVACLLLAVQTRGEEDSVYRKLCQDIIDRATEAAKHHNYGREAEAAKSVAQARAAFAAAAARAPDEPQAFVNFAVFLYNTHQFEEAMAAWETVQGMLEPDSPYQAVARERYQKARVGFVSKQRDLLYKEGKGDTLATQDAVQEQLEYVHSPDIYHDQGTIRLMLVSNNYNDASPFSNSSFLAGRTVNDVAQLAVDSLAFAQKSAFDGWSKGRAALGLCAGQAGLITDWRAAIEGRTSAHNVPADIGLPKAALTSVAHGSPEEILTQLTLYSHNGLQFSESLWGRFPANRSDIVEGVWNGLHYAVAPVRFVSPDSFTVEVERAILNGNEGIIAVSERESKSSNNKFSMGYDEQCKLLVNSGDVYLNLPANVQMLESWRNESSPPAKGLQWFDFWKGKHRYHGMVPPPMVVRVAEAAAVLQYAGNTFYHWLMEGIGRLVLLLPVIRERVSQGNLKLAIIVPNDTTRNKFIKRSIKLIAPDLVKHLTFHRSVEGANDGRYHVDKLHYANWAPVFIKAGMQGIDHRNTSFPLHCVAPAPVLNKIRSAFSEASAIEGAACAERNIVYCTREGENMRAFPADTEASLRAALAGAISDHNAKEGTSFRFIVFNGGKNTPRESYEQFANAAVVVGVHGGALSNIVYCKSGAHVIELGFAGTPSWHFVHASAALGLHHSLVLLPRDPLHRGISAPVVDVNVSVVKSVLQRALAAVPCGRDEL